MTAKSKSGETIPVGLGDARHNVFARVSGHGNPVTMLHGFPTSSIEWQGVLGALQAEHRVLAADFLGFGLSDKPAGLYSIARQADLVEAPHLEDAPATARHLLTALG